MSLQYLQVCNVAKSVVKLIPAQLALCDFTDCVHHISMQVVCCDVLFLFEVCPCLPCEFPLSQTRISVYATMSVFFVLGVCCHVCLYLGAPYLPYEFTEEGLMQRLDAYLTHQDFYVRYHVCILCSRCVLPCLCLYLGAPLSALRVHGGGLDAASRRLPHPPGLLYCVCMFCALGVCNHVYGI